TPAASVPASSEPIPAPIFLYALTLHRLAGPVLRQSRFVRAFMIRKEGITHPRRQMTAHIRAVRSHKPARRNTRLPSPCAPSISARRLGYDMPSLFTASRDSPPVLPVKTPLCALISPSKFPSPFTPANQVLHTPFEPPELHKATPSKRHRNRNWQWSPVLVRRLRSPEVDENSSPARTPTSPNSPVCNLTRRLSLVSPKLSPPASSVHVPRRLSYSQVCASPWTPELRHSQTLASPVLIRSTLWTSVSPVASPCHQLDEFQFPPFHVTSF
ncbi:hypothetical protein B0H11DRAFT_2010893, partial [Mycena galericulata]